MMRPVTAGLAGSLVLLGCGGTLPHTRAAGTLTALSVRPVEWNPAHTPLGRVRAVADAGDVVAVFSDRGATIFSARAAVATDPAIKDWAGAGTISGADGSPRWVVGLDGKGRLYYLRGRSSFEPVSARYGLEGRQVRATTMLGAGYVGFLLDSELALADGHRVTRYATGPFVELGGGSGFAAGVGTDRVVLIGLEQKTVTAFSLPGVTHAALGPGGRLYAVTPRAVYAANERGELTLLYLADSDSIHGLVASGEHVWFADGPELGVIDGVRVAETLGAKISPDARLAASGSGDVWVMDKDRLERYARTSAEPEVANAFATSLAPIFARSCASCHQPNGVSGTDLSTAEAWQAERANIRERVVLRKTMPPQGHPLAEADRDAIRAWATE